MIGPSGRHAQPEIPIQAARNGRSLSWAIHALRPPPGRAIGPDVQFRDVSEHAGANDLDARPGGVRRHALRTHLRRQLFFSGKTRHATCLVDAPGEGLLAIHVFAQLHGRQANGSVHMVGDAHDHGVDLRVHRVEHPAVIAESLCPGEASEGVCCALVIHVAERDDVFVGQLVEVRSALTAATDDGQIQPFVRAWLLGQGMEKRAPNRRLARLAAPI